MFTLKGQGLLLRETTLIRDPPCAKHIRIDVFAAESSSWYGQQTKLIDPKSRVYAKAAFRRFY